METNSSDAVKALRILAKVMSAILIGFALFMFIGEAMESAQKTNNVPMSLNSIVQLVIFGIGLLGLALAWKWGLAGGIASMLAFIALFIVNPGSMVWMMIVFPLNALLFILAGYFERIPEPGE